VKGSYGMADTSLPEPRPESRPQSPPQSLSEALLQAAATSTDEAEKVAELRAAIPAATAGIYLNAGSNGPLPREVEAAMRQVQEQELATGRGSEHIMDDVEVRVDELRGVFASVLATDLELVAVAHSTTEAVIRTVLGVTLKAGDRIVTLDEEYPAIRGSLAALGARLGVTVATVSLRDERGVPISDEQLLEGVTQLLEAPTRLIVISRVSWISGRILPLESILPRARAAGIISIVDGAQSVGAMLDATDALDPDVIAFPSQKWLLGVEGLAGLRLSRRALATDGLSALIGGFLAFEEAALNGVGVMHRDARRFQTSGFARPTLVGAARAAGWLSMQVGLPWAVSRAGRLARNFYAGAAAIPGVELLAAQGRHATIVALRVEGWEAAGLVEELGRRAFAITRRVPGVAATADRPASAPALRTSWGFWNTDEEVARILELLTLIAAHTPESLPKRPVIDIIQR